mgnify:CR=1 FL=1
METVVNETKIRLNDYLTVFEKIKVIDKNAILNAFFNGQVVGIKIIFDCILTNSAIKYIYDKINYVEEKVYTRDLFRRD